MLRVEHEQKSGIGREAVVFASYWLLNKCEHFGRSRATACSSCTAASSTAGRGSSHDSSRQEADRQDEESRSRQRRALLRRRPAPAASAASRELQRARNVGRRPRPASTTRASRRSTRPGIFKNPFAGLSTALHGGSETEFAEEISSVAAPARAQGLGEGEHAGREEEAVEAAVGEHAEHCRDTHAETAPVMLSYSANRG